MDYPTYLSFTIGTKTLVYGLIVVALFAFVGFWGFLFGRDAKDNQISKH